RPHAIGMEPSVTRWPVRQDKDCPERGGESSSGPGGRPRAYCDLEIMYSTAAFRVASSAWVAPRGGMAPLPLSVTCIMASMPFAVRVDHLALSPTLGAPATPAMWQAIQADWYSFSPAGLMVSPAADASAGTSPAIRTAAD